MSEFLSSCPFCSDLSAVRLGGSDGVAVYACVSCGEEFEIDDGVVDRPDQSDTESTD